MNYIILDLEWNTAFCEEKEKYINEIIEIGAVKLDSKLNLIDTYEALIKPSIAKKLRNRVTLLTSITNADVKDARSFTTVLEEFTKWVGKRDTIIMSWGDMDVRVLMDNCSYYYDAPNIPFIKKYLNLQDYEMKVLKLPRGQQVSLSNAALILDIDLDKYPVHRALADSVLSVETLKRTYDKEQFDKRVISINEDFYKRTVFKPYIINNIEDPQVDKGVLNCFCPMCFKPAKKIKDFKFLAGSFRAIYKCPECETKYKVSVQFKRQYDTVKIKKTISPISNVREKKPLP